MRAFLVNLTLLFPMHTWEILTHIALSAPYLALWKAKCWLRRPQIYVGDGVLLTRTLFGHWIYLDGADVNLSPNLLIRGYWEIDLTRLLLRLLRPGMRYVEVGSNCGYYTLLAGSRTGANGSCIAFDANPRMVDLTRRSLAVNGLFGVTVRAAAVGDFSGTATLHVPAHFLGGANVYGADHPYTHSFETSQPVQIETRAVTLDDYFSGDPTPVDILRIDAEGSEPAVLAGAKQLLARSPDAKIILEYIPVLLRKGGRDPKAFLQSLAQDGYSIRKLVGRKTIPLDPFHDHALMERAADLVIERQR